MILKLLLVIGVIAVVYFFFIKKKPIEEKKSKSSKNSSKSQANEMIECASCGTYCEVDDMILSASKYYCSKECLESNR
ncbi:MAG: hypothetical protein J7L21_00060 [Sulfurimonas sp.]|nr:hypothetical protein [Sulfurimonas sp.]